MGDRTTGRDRRRKKNQNPSETVTSLIEMCCFLYRIDANLGIFCCPILLLNFLSAPISACGLVGNFLESLLAEAAEKPFGLVRIGFRAAGHAPLLARLGFRAGPVQ